MFNFELKIQSVRKEKGISQAKMAKHLKTTQQQISKYETYFDLPSLPRLVEIARFLEVSLDQLVVIKSAHKNYSIDLKKR